MGSSERKNGKSSATQTPDLSAVPSFVPSTPSYGSAMTPLASGISQMHFTPGPSRLTPLASPALPPTQINAMVNVALPNVDTGTPFLLDGSADMVSMHRFASAPYGMPSLSNGHSNALGGLDSHSMGSLLSAQSSMMGLAPVTTFMGMLQDQALYAHTMAGLLQETNDQLARLEREKEAMAQQRQKQQTQAGSHSGTRSSPSMESGGSAEAGAEAGDAVNTTTGKRKGRPSKQQDDAAEAKALKKAASRDTGGRTRLQSGVSAPASKPSDAPAAEPPGSGKLTPIHSDVDLSSATASMLSRSFSTPQAINPQLTPLQHPFFTPVLQAHPSPAPVPAALTMLPPAMSLEDMREAPPTPQIRPKLPEAVPASSLEIKSNYQAMLEGQGEALGFSNELVKMVEDKRNVHKYSEKRRRDELKNGFLELRSLIPGAATEKELEDGTYSKATILRQAISYVSFVNKERDNMKTTIAKLQEEIERLQKKQSRSGESQE